jgi:DNA-binding Lrp family transcriptional regulator
MTTPRVFTLTTFLLATTSLFAQQYKNLTSVATFKVAPGKTDAFVERGKAFGPLLDKLVDSGVVLAYGVDVDILHVPGGSNIAFWVDVPDFAALAKEEGAIQEFLKANPAMMQDLAGMSDMSAHRDFIVRAWEENHRAAPAGATPIEDFDMVDVKPERMREFLELFRKYDKPVLDQLVADGVIYGYLLGTEAVHTMKPGFVWQVTTMPDLGAKDKVRAAFSEAMKKLPDAEREMLDRMFYEMVDYSTHRDDLAVSVVFRQK